MGFIEGSIVVDGGVSISCQEVSRADENAECTYTTNDDMSWSVSQEITISEGAYDLCDGSNGGCDVDVTLTKIGVGNEDDMVIRKFLDMQMQLSNSLRPGFANLNLSIVCFDLLPHDFSDVFDFHL